MRTLVISLTKNYPLQTSDDFVVFEYDFLHNDLIYDISDIISNYDPYEFKGSKEELLLKFATDRPKDYEEFIKNIESNLFIALSQSPITESLSVNFPTPYIEWLRYNGEIPEYRPIGENIIKNNLRLNINPQEIYYLYFVDKIYPLLWNVIESNKDIGYFTIMDCDDKNFIIAKDIEKKFDNIKYEPYNGGFIQRSLGNAYLNGVGVGQNTQKAFEFFSNSANKRDAEGIRLLGNLYEMGVGISKDLNKAFNLFKESTSMGNLKARTSLGICYHYGVGVGKDYQKAYECYLLPAKNNDIKAQENLADIYYEGLLGEPDYEMAYTWYLACSESNLKPESYYRLGKMLTEDNGTQQNFEEALKYLYKASQANIKDSCYLCGKIIENKNITGINQDPNDFYKKGAESGEYKSATEYAVYLYNNGNRDKAMELFQIGILKKYDKALYGLSVLLTEMINEGPSEELEKVRDKLLNLAVEQGYGPAKELLEFLKN